MSRDLKGIHQYREDDDEPSFSILLNLLAESVSEAMAYFSGTAVERAALEPAPPGAMWQDTDGPKRLWSTGPDGMWRRHEGVHIFASGTFSPNGALWSRDLSIVLPTIIGVYETLSISDAHAGVTLSAWINVNQITRGPSTTTVVIRQYALSASAQPCAFAWRVVSSSV